MANDLRGEVAFDALGKSWTMKMGTGAMRQIEVETGMPMPKIGRMLENEDTASVGIMVAVFWGALQKHHPGTTMDDCDDIIDEIGQERAGQLIGKAFLAAQAPQKKGDATVRPRKATAA